MGYKQTMNKVIKLVVNDLKGFIEYNYFMLLLIVTGISLTIFFPEIFRIVLLIVCILFLIVWVIGGIMLYVKYVMVRLRK